MYYCVRNIKVILYIIVNNCIEVYTMYNSLNYNINRKIQFFRIYFHKNTYKSQKSFF